MPFTYGELSSLTYTDIEFEAGWPELKAYVNASSADDAFVQECWTEAHALVSRFVGSAVVPAEAIGRATIEVGSELFHRRQAPSGVMQFTTLDGSAVRIARDPMTPAYPILGRWVGMGFA